MELAKCELGSLYLASYQSKHSQIHTMLFQTIIDFIYIHILLLIFFIEI